MPTFGELLTAATNAVVVSGPAPRSCCSRFARRVTVGSGFDLRIELPDALVQHHRITPPI
jgi:hypothetical protein